MTDSKKSKGGKAAKVEKKEDNSLLVALTVTSIGAAAIIGYVAGQVKMADTVFHQINMLISSTPESVETPDDGTVVLSEEALSSLTDVCESIMP